MIKIKTSYQKNRCDNLPNDLTPFSIQTRKGTCHGCYSKEKNIIFVHGVYGDKCLKGLMQILINRFKTNKIVFTPLITESIPNKVKGEIKTLLATHPDNPYGEDIRYMETEWE